MKNLNKYIFEKLSINKDTKIIDSELFEEVKWIIIYWIRNNLRCNISDCEIKMIKEKEFSLTLPNSQNDLIGIGTALCTEINKKQKKEEFYWSADKENNRLLFGTDII